MPADVPATPPSNGTTAFLLARIDRGGLLRVGAAMLLASLTEGLGLVLLVPLTQSVAGSSAAAILGPWGAALAAVPLGWLLGGFVALVGMRAALLYAIAVQRTAMARALVRRLREELHGALLGAEWRWLSGRRSADHAALIVGEAERIGMEADRALDLASAGVTLAALLAAALWLSWPLTLATLALGGVTAAVWLALRGTEDGLAERFAAGYRRLQEHVVNGLAHWRAARIAGAEHALEREFAATAAELETVERRYYVATHRAHLGLQVIAAAMLALLVWFGLKVLALPLALFVPVLAIFVRIVPLLGAMQQGWRSWRFCRPAVATLSATLAEARAAAEPPAAPGGPPLALTRGITLDRVSFAFPGRERAVLRDFSHTIAAGSVTSVVGPSGAGKSTLADLLAGLIAPDSGTIRIDDVLLEGEQRIRWRRQIAYVEQVPHLFDGTIAANLTWGSGSPGEAQLHRALRDASAEFVLALPRGLDTRVGEIGRHLSGGERQRISLARALLRQPALMILDEVTAALDAASESAIGATIERLRGRTTFVILGHRPALHALADDVITLAP